MTQSNNPQNPAPPPPPPAGPPPVPPKAGGVEEVRTLAMLAHVLNFTFIGPLIIYLVKKGADPFLDDQAKESLNFALICFIAQFAIGILGYMIWPVRILSGGISIVQLVLGILGGLKARDGIAYRYPIQFKLIP
jgi:uncharacterized Tic20 family protein